MQRGTVAIPSHNLDLRVIRVVGHDPGAAWQGQHVADGEPVGATASVVTHATTAPTSRRQQRRRVPPLRLALGYLVLRPNAAHGDLRIASLSARAQAQSDDLLGMLV
jgi:hypothetical protein